MKYRNHTGLWTSSVWLAGLLLIGLVLPARPAGKSPGDCKVEECQEWDEYEHDCVDMPKNCVILAWFGEDRDDGDCNQGITYNTRDVPICGTKTKTIKYQEHKSWCKGHYAYEHDSRNVIYTWIITTCRPRYVGPSIADDIKNAAGLAASCLEVLLQLVAATQGAGNYPDASNVASCLESLANYYNYDVSTYYSGCEVADIQWQGAVFKCTLLGEGCGE